MGNSQNNKSQTRSIWAILFNVIPFIMATFGSVVFNFKIPSFVLGIITCVVLIVLLSKEYGFFGTLIGILISMVLMTLMVKQLMKNPAYEFSGKIDDNTKLGNMELCIEELVVKYGDKDGDKKITSNIDVTKNMCETIILNSIDYDVKLDRYKVKDGKIIFSNIPVGTYDIKIGLEGFSQYSGTIKLKESELSEGIWNRTICVQSESEYKNFQIIISDSEGDVLKSAKCDFNVLDTSFTIKDIVSDSEGKLPYTFSMPMDTKFQLILYLNDEIYSKEYIVSEIDVPLHIQFSTPPKEKIQLSEYHQADDDVTTVSWDEWNVNEDLGIDGKRYGGGIKVYISNFFIEMGYNGSKDITSRIIVPINRNYGETTFSGVFVLDKSMYGTNSTGTISILVNNEVVYSTGEIGGTTVESFPFNINFGDADSIIIMTEAHLSGSSFIYGCVSEK